MFLIPFQTLLKILNYSQKHLTVPWLSTVGCVPLSSDNNLYWMGEVLLRRRGQIDSKLRSGRPASLLPRTTGTLKGALHREAKGPVLTKADLQLSHYTTGREGRAVTTVTFSRGFKYCNSKIHFFVSHRRGARHMRKATVCWRPVFFFYEPCAVAEQQLSPLRKRRMTNPQRGSPRQKYHSGFPQAQQRVEAS